MKTRAICALLGAMILMILPACNGGGGSDTGTGTISMDITDAKPFIDGGQPDELWLVFDEVLVHKSGGGWESLNLPNTPLEINLLAFSDGHKTEMVTPTQVTEGLITQVRFVISEAYMVFYGDPSIDIDLDVPSGTLKTDKQVDWRVVDGGSLDYTVHFDLSKSIVQTGPDEYKLKPVLHLFNNDPQEGATICGTIHTECFGNGEPVVITVKRGTVEEEKEPYTRVTVTETEDEHSTETVFCIFWLVPDESYILEFDTDGDQETAEHTMEPVSVNNEEITNLEVLMCPPPTES